MRSKIFYGIVTLFLLFALYSCDLFSEGYGDKADLRDPELSIDGNNGGFIKGVFTLTGTAADDIKVKDVSVSITNYGNNLTETRAATLSGKKWSLKFDTTSNPLFTDGELEFIVKVTDTSNKSLSKKRLLFVDNLKPTVLINTPDKYGAGESYNQKIIVKGETKDYKVKENIVSLIHIATGEKFSVEADRTPSWSATFNTGAFLDDSGQTIVLPQGQYYLIVESTDMAGNTNDYFYHTSDTQNAIEINKKATVEDLANPANQEIQRVKDIRRDSTNKIEFHIDPNSDLPQIKIENWQVSGGNFVQKDFKGSVDIVANFSDDDGLDELSIAVFNVGADYTNDAEAIRYETYTVSNATKVYTQQQFSANLMSLDWGIFGTHPPDATLETALSKEGQYIIRFIASDTNVAGDKKYTAPLLVPYRIDGGAPTLSVTKESGQYIRKDPTSGKITSPSYTNGDFIISGSASDGSGVGVIIKVEDVPNNRTNYYLAGEADSVVETVDWTFYSKDAQEVDYDPVTATYDAAPYPAKINLLDLVDRSLTVTVIATDGGKTTEQALGQIIIDTHGPDVTIEIPQGGAILNGIADVVVRYNDDATINTGTVSVIAKYYENSADTTQVGSDIVINRDTVRVYNIASSWYGFFDTTEENSLPKYDKVEIIATVEDNAGNPTYKTTTVKVDQSTDKPNIIFNLDKDRDSIDSVFDSVNGHNLIQNSGIISGSIKDDDGIPANSMEIAFFNRDKTINGVWETVNNPSSNKDEVVTWSHPIPTGITDGIYGVAVKVIDVNYDSVTPANTPNSFYKTNSGDIIEFFFGYDTMDPNITIDSLSTSSYIKSKFKVTSNISDANGISSVEVKVTNVDDSTQFVIDTTPVETPVDSGVWVSREFDLSDTIAFDEADYIIEVTAKDKFSRVKTVSTTYTLDRVGPVVNITNPAVLDELNGVVQFSGTASDISDIETMHYSISDTPDATDLSTGWTVIANSGKNWNFTYDTDTYNGNRKFTVLAVDKAGNVSSIVSSANQIDTVIDQSKDKPVVSLTNYDLGKFAGNMIQGKVTDDDGVDTTSIEISFGPDADIANAGAYKNIDPTKVIGNGIFVTFSYQILESDVDTDGNGIIDNHYIFIRAKDLAADKLGGKPAVSSDALSESIITDWAYPVINNFTLASDSTGYESYISNQTTKIDFTANITDDTLLDESEIKVKYTYIDSGEKTGEVLLTKVSGDDFSGTLDLTTPNGSKIKEGLTKMTLEAKDQFQKFTSKELDIIKDMGNPSASSDLTLSGNTNINETIINDIIELAGKSSDDPTGTGIDKVEVIIGTNPAELVDYNSLSESWSLSSSDISGEYSTLGSTINWDSIPAAHKGALADDPKTKGNYYGDILGYGLFNGVELIDTEIYSIPITIRSYDMAGNSTDTVINVLYDDATDKPIISIENINKAVAPIVKDRFHNDTITFTIEDDDLVNATKIQYSITNSGDIAPGSWSSLALDASYNSKKVSVDKKIEIGVTPGDKKLWVRATDDLSATPLDNKYHNLGAPIEFTIDRVAPSIKSLTISDDSIKIGDANPTITVVVKEDTQLATAMFKYKDINGIDVEENVIPAPSVVPGFNEYTFIYPLDISNLKEKTTEFTFEYVDQFNKVVTITDSIYKDTFEPIVSMTSPVSTNNLNGAIEVKGNVDDYEVSSLTLAIEKFDKDGLNPELVVAPAFSYLSSDNKSWKIDLDSLTDFPANNSDFNKGKGSYQITIEATDRVGNTTTFTETLNVDQSKDYPTISFDILNKVMDEYTLGEDIIINHDHNNNVIAGILNTTEATAGKEVVNVKLENVSTSDIYNLEATELDNVGPENIAWYLDLSSDKSTYNAGDQKYYDSKFVPAGTYKITEILVNGVVPTTTYLGVIGQTVNTFRSNNTTINAVVQDDDEIDSTKTSIGIIGTTAVTTSPITNSKYLNVEVGPLADGIYLIDPTVTDINLKTPINSDFTPKNNKQLVVQDSSRPVVEINKDLHGETILGDATPINATSYNPESGYSNKVDFVSVGRATDGLAISNLSIVMTSFDSGNAVVFNSIDEGNSLITNLNTGGSEIVEVDGKTWEWRLKHDALPDNYTSKSRTIKYIASDLVGNKTIKEQQIIVDTEAPNLQITSPADGTTVNGDLKLTGYGSDNGQLVSMKLILGDKSPVEYTIPTAEFTGWSHVVDTNVLIRDHISDGKILTDPDSGEKLSGDLTVGIEGVDAAGNDSYKEITIVINPNADRPIVNIVSPVPESGMSTVELSGPIRLMGTAEDDDAPQFVELKVNYDGGGYDSSEDLFTYDPTGSTIDKDSVFKEGLENENNWFRVDLNNGSWKHTLNSVGEYNRSNVHGLRGVNQIEIMVRAVDINGLAGIPKTITIDIDEDSPVIHQFKVIDDKDNTVSKDVTIYGEVSDNDAGITADDELIISFGSHSTTLTHGGSFTPPAEPAWVNEKYYINSDTGRAEFKFNQIVLDKGYILGDSKLGSIEINVTDESGKIGVGIANLGIDLVDPSSIFTGNITDLGFNEMYVSGVAEDLGYVSGIDQVRVYFLKRGVGIFTILGLHNGAADYTIPDSTDLKTYQPGANYSLVIDNHKEAYGEPDTDGVEESIKYNLGKYEWSGVLTKTLSEKVKNSELHYIVIDNGGNSEHYNEVAIDVGTDRNSDGEIKPEEIGPYLNSLTVRDYLYIKPQLTVGTLSVEYKKKGEPDSAYTNLPVPGDNIFDLTNTTTYPDGEYNFRVTVTDGSPLLVKELDIYLINSDLANPIVVSTVSISENSIVTSGLTKEGHYDNIGGRNKLSGKVIVRGTATDDLLLKDIKVRITNMKSPTATPDVFEEKVIFDNVVIAKWNASMFEGVNAGNGLKGITIPTDSSFDYDNVSARHKVNFSLEWDTSYITDGAIPTDTATRLYAAENIKIEFIAEDASDTTGKLSEYKQVSNDTYDIVPYITSFERNSTHTTHRAKSGAFSLLREETGNRVIGFNLNSGADNLSIGTTKIATTSVVDGKELSFDLPATAKSGKAVISVNGIDSTNNENTNTLDYNSERNPYLAETEFWTDDRYIRVWESNNSGVFDQSENPIFPTMSMNSSGTLYSSFSNYSTASVYYATLTNRSRIFSIFDPTEETDIVVTGTNEINVLYAANYHGGGDVNWTRSSDDAGGIYLYDNDAPSDSYSSTYGTHKRYRFELYYHNRMLQQFKNIRTTRGTNDIIHNVYYDVLSNSIKYASISDTYTTSYKKTHERAWVKLDGGSDSTPDEENSRLVGTNITLTDARFENGLTRSSGTGEYSSIAVDEQNFPVVVYLDSTTNKLRLARANNLSPYSIDNWKVQTIMESTDDNYGLARDYLNIKVDSSGFLHIAFRNSKGELCYIKSTNNPNNGSAYTFSKSVVVDKDGLRADLTLQGTTPYISYLSKVNAFDGLKVAFIDNSMDIDGDGSTGDWETMNASMNGYKAVDTRTSIEAHPDVVSPAVKPWEAAIGYSSGDYYRVAYYIGE